MTKTLMITLAAALLSSMINVQAFAQSDDRSLQVASAGPVVRVDDVAAAKALRAFIAAQRPMAGIAAPDMNGPRR